MNTLAARLKEVRGDTPQAEFAEFVGINKSSWGRYERGETEPSGSDLINICRLCNVVAEWLLLGRGSMRHGEQPQPAEPAQQLPVTTTETAGCARCAKMEAKVDALEEERRELTRENRALWRDNGELREENATMRERLREPFSKRTMGAETA